MSGYRLTSDTGATPVSFKFNGKTYQGVQGDTLASALLANGVTLVGRSFKYHRPRGIFSAGSEEPNAAVNVVRGDELEPNTLATTLEIYNGLEAKSQNCWPSVDFDVNAINSLLSPIFVAGFYYKTFMGTSNKHWMFFEKHIRKAAGMGEASVTADSSRYEKQNVFCDVLIVGAGPAGISAALTQAATGARVVLADENAQMGGALIGSTQEIAGQDGDGWVREQLEKLKTFDNVKLLPRTTVYGYYDNNTFGAVERVSDHLTTSEAKGKIRQRHLVLKSKKVILATGALERPILFGDNDRPGVMLASAVGKYVKRYGVVPGREIVMFTNNDSIYQEIAELGARNVPIKAVVDLRDTLSDYAAAVKEKYNLRIYHNAAVVRAVGGKALKSVILNNGETLTCDVLGVSGGWTPTIHLQSQQGDKPVYDETICSFLPGMGHQDYVSIGACKGSFDLSACLSEGGLAEVRVEDEPSLNILPVFDIETTKGKKFVDLQHDVKTSDIKLAKQEGFLSVEHLKRYTTLGMANDQGKTANVNALVVMSKERQLPITEVGTTRFRPPYAPVSIGALSGGEYGEHFRPTRRTPMHEWHLDHGAEMINAGAWVRPRVYKKAGETVTDAYIREAAAVRESVGMVDVTSLGKIEVIGPDAPEFLNRVYTNAWLKLPVGKARYGVMLREDGHVFDDGTTWRLEENRFLMTTTTANAANVLTHLEFLLDVIWPELKVKVVSVTEQWAGLAIAGPNSRAVLAKALHDVDMSNEAFPFMAVQDAKLGDIPVKVARLSFSGELAYEVWCPSHYGYAMWDQLYQAGQDFNITPYGTEALGTLRIEKGHISGPELDGRTTVDDLDLGWAWGKKDFVGKPLAGRDGMVDEDRLKLVGLVSKEEKAIRPGSQIVLSNAETTLGVSQGHVTSTTYSPALGKYIALALVKNGRNKIGETVYATYPLKNESQAVEIVKPHFFDPDGSRMHV
ncbi:MAG: sarcosine oxidase subunit alpha family protein [Methylocystaceae bacterium]|nr:sarcosine oxidase subunit alpha family protein [Methylocystaceae bacterium]